MDELASAASRESFVNLRIFQMDNMLSLMTFIRSRPNPDAVAAPAIDAHNVIGPGSVEPWAGARKKPLAVSRTTDKNELARSQIISGVDVSDARDEYGNFKNGYSFDEGQRAGATASDSTASVELKIQQMKSDELKDRLGKFGPGAVHSNPKPKGRTRVFFLAMFSFAFIANYAWRFFAFVLETSSWDRGGVNGELPHDFWWKMVFALAVIGGAAFMLWCLTIKFFKWLCS